MFLNHGVSLGYIRPIRNIERKTGKGDPWEASVFSPNSLDINLKPMPGAYKIIQQVKVLPSLVAGAGPHGGREELTPQLPSKLCIYVYNTICM